MKPKGNSWALGIFLSRELDELGLDPYTFRVYAHLCRRANDELRAFPSIPDMASVCKISDRSVQRALRVLDQAGFITREAQYRKDGSRTVDLLTLHGPFTARAGDSQSPGGAAVSPPGDSRSAHEGIPLEGIPSSPLPAGRGEGQKATPIPFQSGRIDPGVRLRHMFENRTARAAARSHVETFEKQGAEWLRLPADFLHAVLDHAVEQATSSPWGLVAMALSNPNTTEKNIPAAFEVWQAHRAAKQPVALEPISCPGTYETDGGLVTVEEVRDGAAFTTDGRIIVLARTAGWKPARGVAA